MHVACLSRSAPLVLIARTSLSHIRPLGPFLPRRSDPTIFALFLEHDAAPLQPDCAGRASIDVASPEVATFYRTHCAAQNAELSQVRTTLWATV